MPLINELIAKVGRAWRLWLILAVAVAVRIYVYAAMHPLIHTDSITFLFLNELDMVRTPGYPLFNEILFSLNDLFGLTTDYFRLLCFGQLFLLGTANALMIAKISEILTSSRNFALAMGLIYNFNYFVVGFEIQIMTETLSVTLMLAVMILYLKRFYDRRSVAILAGLLTVLLIYSRATFLLWGIGLPLLSLILEFPKLRKTRTLGSRGRLLLLFAVVNIAGIGAWSLRNWIKYDYPGVSSLMPYQLRYYTNSMFEKYRPAGDPLLDTVARIYREEYQKTKGASSTIYNFHVRLNQELGLSDAQISRAFMRVNLKLIRDNPLDFISQVPGSIESYFRQYSPYWTSGNNGKLLNREGLVPLLFRSLFTVYQNLFHRPILLFLLVIAVPIGLLAVVFRDRERFIGWMVILATIHYNGLVSVLSTSAGINNMRYRQPVEPLILLMFYAGIFLLLRLFWKSMRKGKVLS